MQIELSLERFINLYRLVSLGKLVQGLVHNLNGPLQNLGMDMEMLENGLGAEGTVSRDLRDSVLRRLRRMEGEFDRIIRLIKTASSRIGMEGEYGHCLTFHAFLEEEISFLNANLHFKHNVQKDLRVPEGLPALDHAPQAVILSLAWLMQALVDETERSQAKLFSLKASSPPSAVEIAFSLEGESLAVLPEGIVPEVSSDPLRLEEPLELRLPLAVLRMHGVELTLKSEPTRLTFTLRIPIS